MKKLEDVKNKIDPMQSLTDYLFHYSIMGEWNAFKREDKHNYFNDKQNCKSLITNKDINIIIDFISTQVK